MPKSCKAFLKPCEPARFGSVSVYSNAALWIFRRARTILTIWGVSWLSLRQSRKMKLPIWVIPPAAFEMASTGTPACCASGSTLSAVSDRVGPMIAST